MKYLCEDFKVDKEAVDELGQTPLYVAADQGNSEVAEYLSVATGVPVPVLPRCVCALQ